MEGAITLTAEEVLYSKHALREFINTSEIPVKPGYSASQNAKKIEREAEIVEERREAIYREHGEYKDGQMQFDQMGNPIWKDEEGAKKLKELMALPVIENWEPGKDFRIIKLSSLGRDFKMRPAVWYPLDWMFEDDLAE